MEIHQIKKEILPDGTIVIDDLPFDAKVGDMITITLEKIPAIDRKEPYPLQGTAYSFSDPLGPVIPLRP
jgi:hypothetical protein